MGTTFFRSVWLLAGAVVLVASQQEARSLPFVSPIFADTATLKLLATAGPAAIQSRLDDWPGLTAISKEGSICGS